MGNTHAKLLFSLEQERDGAAEIPAMAGNHSATLNEQHCIESIVTTHAAYINAIERVLGAPENSLYRIDAEAVKVWVTALGGDA